MKRLQAEADIPVGHLTSGAFGDLSGILNPAGSLSQKSPELIAGKAQSYWLATPGPRSATAGLEFELELATLREDVVPPVLTGLSPGNPTLENKTKPAITITPTAIPTIPFGPPRN